jgi:phosphatidylserine decarboxylase
MTIHKEGRAILLKMFLVFLVINLCVYYFSPCIAKTTSIISLLGFLFFVNFFRRPQRIISIDDPNLVLAPRDGKVVVIEPTIETEVLGEKRIQISIFMNVFNVHANWYPIGGTVTYYVHNEGRFMAAHLPKSSTENERSTVVIETESKAKVLVRQVAGAVAQRIVTYAFVGQKCNLNDELGFIKFGSRMDIYLPMDTEILVDLKQKTVGNQTPIARLKS